MNINVSHFEGGSRLIAICPRRIGRFIPVVILFPPLLTRTPSIPTTTNPSTMTTPIESPVDSMLYRTLGNTGMVTSVFGFGFWATFGIKVRILLLHRNRIFHTHRLYTDHVEHTMQFLQIQCRSIGWSFGSRWY